MSGVRTGRDRTGIGTRTVGLLGLGLGFAYGNPSANVQLSTGHAELIRKK